MVITAEVGEGRVTQTYRLTPVGGGGAETGIYSTRETRNTISPVQTCNQKLIREEEAGGDKRGLCKADHVAPYFFFFFSNDFFRFVYVSFTYSIMRFFFRFILHASYWKFLSNRDIQNIQKILAWP